MFKWIPYSRSEASWWKKQVDGDDDDGGPDYDFAPAASLDGIHHADDEASSG